MEEDTEDRKAGTQVSLTQAMPKPPILIGKDNCFLEFSSSFMLTTLSKQLAIARLMSSIIGLLAQGVERRVDIKRHNPKEDLRIVKP